MHLRGRCTSPWWMRDRGCPPMWCGGHQLNGECSSVSHPSAGSLNLPVVRDGVLSGGSDGTVIEPEKLIRIQVVDDDLIGARGWQFVLESHPQIAFLDPVPDTTEVAPNGVSLVLCDLHLRDSQLSGPNAVRYLSDKRLLPV